MRHRDLPHAVNVGDHYLVEILRTLDEINSKLQSPPAQAPAQDGEVVKVQEPAIPEVESPVVQTSQQSKQSTDATNGKKRRK